MKNSISPNSLFESTQFGFSQITVSEPGKMVFISGQISWDENMNIIGKQDLEKQTEKSILNLQEAMKVIGGTLDDIVMLRIYIVDYKRGDGTTITKVLKKYFGTENPPSSTWVNVKGLANEDFMIEIEAQAII